MPTFFPFEASSPEPEEEEIRKELSNGGDGTDEVYSVDLEMPAEDGRSIPVLLSEEMLAQLIKASEEEQHDVEKDEEDGNEDDIERIADTDEESVEIILEPNNDGEEQQQKEEDLEEEEVGGSTESEIPVDLDYTADSVSTETQNTKLEENKPLTIKFEDEEKMDNELPTVMEDYDTKSNQDDDYPDEHQEKPFDQGMFADTLQDEQILPDPEIDQSNTDEDKESMELAEKKLSEEKEGEKDTHENGSHAQGKHKRMRKAQSDQALSAEETSDHSQNQEPDKEAEIRVNMVQRKMGKWVRWDGRSSDILK